jgi:hypothetical protein
MWEIERRTMQTVWVAVAYLFAVLLALALLYTFHARWYWHVLSVLAALAIGLAPPPEGWHPPDLLVGSVFLFLFVWGIAAPFFRPRPS